jgi:hypothetical protein
MMTIHLITEALLSLRPGAQWSLDGDSYEFLEWNNQNELPPPTEEEIREEAARLQQIYENNQYQRDRASAYPSIQDQLDILYHKGYDGWKEEINKIKQQYPKPEGS